MSVGNIRPSLPGFEPELNSANIAEATSVVFDIHKKKVKVTKSQIKDVAKGLAEIAFSMGETNDVEEFTEEMAMNILKGFKKAEEEEKRKKKKK